MPEKAGGWQGAQGGEGVVQKTSRQQAVTHMDGVKAGRRGVGCWDCRRTRTTSRGVTGGVSGVGGEGEGGGTEEGGEEAAGAGGEHALHGLDFGVIAAAVGGAQVGGFEEGGGGGWAGVQEDGGAGGCGHCHRGWIVGGGQLGEDAGRELGLCGRRGGEEGECW